MVATLCAGLGATAFAQDATPAAADVVDGSGAAVAEGSGTAAADVAVEPEQPMATVRVVAERHAPGGFEPLPDAAIKVHLVVPPHDLLGSIDATTGADGRTEVDIPFVDGLEVVVEAVDGDRRYFSESIALREHDMDPVRVETYPVAHDPSAVEAERMVTVLSLSEGYVVVQQVWHLVTRNGTVFRPDMSGVTGPPGSRPGGPAGPPMAGRFAAIPMPADAEGISVIEPQGVARVVGAAVFFGGEVLPVEISDPQQDRLVVQYSLPLEGRSTMRIEQPLAMPVQTASVMLPSETHFSRYRQLDVAFDEVPCSDRVVCFEPPTTTREAHVIEIGVDAAQIQARDVPAGRGLVIETSGWPSPRTYEREAAAGAAAAALLLGAGLFVGERRRRRRDAVADARAALEGEREALLSMIAELDARLRAGELLEHDHDVARAHARERLGVVYRRLRELEGDGAAAPAANA